LEVIVKQSILGSSVVVLTLALSGGASYAQGKLDFGQREFESSCASCHGASAKGDGALRHFLNVAPPDLTLLSRRSGGVFPYQQMWETIDGRNTVGPGAHGTRDMPVWGYVYLDDEQHTNGWLGRNRIAALLDYLNRIQVK
jgi:mono/diheme cytochrome c family protein